MNNSITPQSQLLSRINKSIIDQKERAFQRQNHPSYLSLHATISVLPHFWDKSRSYLRTGLFANLGVMLIGLIYKVQLTNIPFAQILLSLTRIVLSVKATLISLYAVYYQYAFAKAYKTFNPFYGHSRPIHKPLKK